MNSPIAIAQALPRDVSTRVHTQTRVNVYTLTVLACAALCILIAIAVLIGWSTGNEALMTVLPSHIRMKPNAALAFLVAGASLASLLHPAARLASRITALFVLVLGALTTIEYATGLNFGIDQILFLDPAQSLAPGRMAHISAVNFCLAGIALLLLTGGPRARRFAQAAALLLTAIASVAICAFIYGAPILFGSNGYASMALHTGLSFLLLGVGLLLAPSDSVLVNLFSSPQRGTWLGRRILPAALFLPILLGWLYLRPFLSFGNPVFAMALFAVTLAAAGTAAVWQLGLFLNREERQLAEIDRLREQTAAAVRQSEHELRLITDHLPILLSYTDAHGRFVRVNRTYELWLGRSAEDIVGKNVRELLGDEYWLSTLPARARVLAGETVTFETEYPTLQGHRHTQNTYAPDFDAQGNLRGMACLVLDMHDRRQAEAALRQSEKLAAVGRMASSIAHEINNPLEAVTNLLYLAQHETTHLPVASGYVLQAQTELARVTHIVTQTLRFHRQSTNPVLCRMSDVLRQVLVLYQGRLAQGNIAVEQRFRDPEPLLCRDGEIRQAIANLIGNAADAMAPNAATPHRTGKRLLLRTSARTDPHTGQPQVTLTIADTGHGIPEATRRRLFEPFHTTKGATGSGLGLWITKEIIDRHAGHLRLRSSVRPGRSGTVFRITLSNLLTDPKA